MFHALILQVICVCSLAQPATTRATTQPVEDPGHVVKRFVELLRAAKVDDTRALVLPMNMPAETDATGTRLRRMAEVLSFVQRGDVVETKSNETTALAVIVFARSAIPGQLDLDPQLLVRRDGRWLILIDAPHYYRELTTSERAEIDQLNEWFKSEEQAIRARVK